MNVQFKMEGGLAHFPGLSRPLTLESAELPAADAAELERLVAAADFFSLPAQAGPPRPQARDVRRYTITVEAPGTGVIP